VTTSMKLLITFSGQVADKSTNNVKAPLTLPYQNSDAESVLMHHRDIALFREVRSLITENVSCSTFYAARRQHKCVCPVNWEPAAYHSGWERGFVITIAGSLVAHALVSGNNQAPDSAHAVPLHICTPQTSFIRD